MAIAIKTFLHTSGLNRLSNIMTNGMTGYVIPKERWKASKGKYVKYFDINKECIPNGFKLWSGEPISELYSFETMMLNLSWVNKLRKRGVKVYDIPMIEWVERKKFEEGAYSVFDKILCLNDYCYDIFSSRYDNCERRTFDLPYKYDNLDKRKVIYHQASCSSYNHFKNTENVIDAFINLNSSDYKLVITGIIHDSQKTKIQLKNIEYKGIVNYDVVLDLFKTSEIYLSPSLQEGLSIPLYEARSYGCKIITTNFSPMKEVGDILCDPVILEEGGKFMYPKLSLDSDEILKKLKSAIS